MVPGLLVGKRRGKAEALGGVQVQHDRVVRVAKLEERRLHRGLVVAVLEVAVVEPHRAEEVVRCGAAALAQPREAAVDAAVVFGNGPLVVVHDDDEAAAQFGCAVEALEGQAARERPVADDGHDAARLAGEVARLGKAHGQAH